MKIGIFSGSFNPIHIGHLILANYIVEYTNIERVWFVVTPQNPLKSEGSLLDEKERLRMVELATKGFEKLEASDFEFSLPRPSYTVETLFALSEKYPEHEFILVIGADNWASFENWKNHDEIVEHHKIMVYPRLGSRISIPMKLKNRVEALESPIIDISSTIVREGIEESKNIKPLLPKEVADYIEEKNLYR